MYHEQADREPEKYRPEPFIARMTQYIREKRLMNRFCEKEEGKLSAFELLEKMD